MLTLVPVGLLVLLLITGAAPATIKNADPGDYETISPT